MIDRLASEEFCERLVESVLRWVRAALRGKDVYATLKTQEGIRQTIQLARDYLAEVQANSPQSFDWLTSELTSTEAISR